MCSAGCVISIDAIAVRDYDEVRSKIRDADLILKRGGGLIPIAGRGVHRHAGMACWWDLDLMLLEMAPFRGGRAVTLRSQVKRYPGRLDVFETAPGDRWPSFDRAEAARFMRRLAGQDYDYAGIFSISCLHLPLVRLLPCVRRLYRRPWSSGRNSDDCRVCLGKGDLADRLGPRFCSQAISLACNVGGGVDPVPMLADRLTEPADLARSQFFRYRFTLT